jgi:hypothetical protein
MVELAKKSDLRELTTEVKQVIKDNEEIAEMRRMIKARDEQIGNLKTYMKTFSNDKSPVIIKTLAADDEEELVEIEPIITILNGEVGIND